MAQLFPSDTLNTPPALMKNGLRRELDVLRALSETLPDEYSLYHSVDWYSVYDGYDRIGEIDIVVMAPDGALLLVEIKSGLIEESVEGLFKQYAKQLKDIGKQCRVQYCAMLNRLQQADLKPALKHLLVLPDYRMIGPGTASWPRERIVDADEYSELGAKVLQLLPLGARTELTSRVQQFLLNTFKVAKSFDVLQGQLQRASHRLAEGLATWVPRLETPGGVLWIQATAGSGKTQLALQLLRSAADRGKRALYMCFNRSLADLMLPLVPAEVHVTNFNRAAFAYCRSASLPVDFSRPGENERIADIYLAAVAPTDAAYDLIIVDEGQDFHTAWIGKIRQLMQSGGRFYFFEDPDQRLYNTDPLNLPEATRLSCPDNFRSPRAIVDTINAFKLNSQEVRSASAFVGDAPDILVYEHEADMVDKVEESIFRYLAAGFSINDIVVLTFNGMARSIFWKRTVLAGVPITRFTGRYSSDASPEWSEGKVLCETIYRFKGQAAPVVIVAEVDFVSMTDMDRRKLFVALTRARMAVTLVVSANAEKALAAQLV